VRVATGMTSGLNPNPKPAWQCSKDNHGPCACYGQGWVCAGGDDCGCTQQKQCYNALIGCPGCRSLCPEEGGSAQSQ
jgi:hypothetical protein